MPKIKTRKAAAKRPHQPPPYSGKQVQKEQAARKSFLRSKPNRRQTYSGNVALQYVKGD
jgi:ribosomal protein L35